jgi:hypothetical protein
MELNRSQLDWLRHHVASFAPSEAAWKRALGRWPSYSHAALDAMPDPELAEAHDRATERGDLMLATEIEAAQAARLGHV